MPSAGIKMADHPVPNTWQNRAYNLIRTAGSCFWIANLKNEKEKLILEQRLKEIHEMERLSVDRSNRNLRQAKQTLLEMQISAQVHRDYDLVNLEKAMRERQEREAAAARKHTPLLLPQLRHMYAPVAIPARLPSQTPTLARRLSTDEARRPSIGYENQMAAVPSEMTDEMAQVKRASAGIVKKNSGVNEEIPILDILQEQSEIQLEQINLSPTRDCLPAIGSAQDIHQVLMSEQRPKEKSSPKTSARRQGLPRECRNGYSFRKCMEDQVASALERREKPEEKNRKKLEKLIMQEHQRLPGVIQRRKSTSAIFRDFDQLRANRRHSNENVTRSAEKCGFIKMQPPPQVTDGQNSNAVDFSADSAIPLLGPISNEDKVVKLLAPDIDQQALSVELDNVLKQEQKLEANQVSGTTEFSTSPVRRLRNGAYLGPMRNEPYIDSSAPKKDIEQNIVETADTEKRPSRKRKSNTVGIIK